MTDLHTQSDANRTLEGGIFYPTGHIVLALPDADAARKLWKRLGECGIEDVMHAPASDMAREARENLDAVTPIMSFGASLPVRQRQMELAQEGCDFLIVKAESDAEEERVLALLSGIDVRYAVKYRTLVIENLLSQIPAAGHDAVKTARVP